MIIFQALTVVNFALCLYIIFNLNNVIEVINDVVESLGDLWDKEEEKKE